MDQNQFSQSMGVAVAVANVLDAQESRITTITDVMHHMKTMVDREMNGEFDVVDKSVTAMSEVTDAWRKARAATQKIVRFGEEMARNSADFSDHAGQMDMMRSDATDAVSSLCSTAYDVEISLLRMERTVLDEMDDPRIQAQIEDANLSTLLRELGQNLSICQSLSLLMDSMITIALGDDL